MLSDLRVTDLLHVNHAMQFTFGYPLRWFQCLLLCMSIICCRSPPRAHELTPDTVLRKTKSCVSVGHTMRADLRVCACVNQVLRVRAGDAGQRLLQP